MGGALAAPYNVANMTTPSAASSYWWTQNPANTGPGGYAQLATFSPSASATRCATNSTCPNAAALEKGADATPYTMNWDLMLDQQLAGRMMMELSYIGNRTEDVPLTNNSTNTETSFSNI